MQTPSASGHVTSSGVLESSNDNKRDNASFSGTDEDSDDATSDEESGEFNVQLCPTLRELLLRPKCRRMNARKVVACVNEMLRVDREASAGSSVSNSRPVSIDTVKESVNAENEQVKEVELLHFKRQAFETPRIRQMLPVRTMIMADSERMYPEVPHSWLCNGRLLQLHDPINPGNSNLFQV